MWRAAVLIGAILVAKSMAQGERSTPPTPGSVDWRDEVLQVPYDPPALPEEPILEIARHEIEALQRDQSVINTPLRLADRQFDRGLGTHAPSHLMLYSPQPVTGFRAWVGVDNNERTSGVAGTVVFVVRVDGREVFRSPVMSAASEPLRVDVEFAATQHLSLIVEDAGDGVNSDHADWAEPELVTADGGTLQVGAFAEGEIPGEVRRYPFSFVYYGTLSDELLPQWPGEVTTSELEDGRTRSTTVWSDPHSGLRVTWETTTAPGFASADWLLWFANEGEDDTGIVEAVRPLDLIESTPIDSAQPYLLHSAKGGTPTPDQLAPSVDVVGAGSRVMLESGHGRSSGENLPFFKVQSGRGSIVMGLGWTGEWRVDATASRLGRMRLSGGMAETHFRLHPGERVRTPRVLALFHDGETLEANAQFRQLIQDHYALAKEGDEPLPTLFSNTCFTRGGGWLNECNEENQVSLIRAYAPLGLEAVITDAGWFEGGWPNGAGNWTPRKDAYPDGMAPVAAAAEDVGMSYGLWFEPERVMPGTDLQRNHPEWLLRAGDEPQGVYLLNMAIPEAREYFLDIVGGFMELPGFAVYRQDFNMDPWPMWRYHDAPDRVGITEMKYIEGLYTYWEELHRRWPDAILEGCASGGHRIDLGSIMRMHFHQKTDYWFDYEVDQAALFSAAQYLPNNTLVAHVDVVDEYAYRSTMASSLCIGWIADAEGFDQETASALLSEYNSVKHLLTGAFYPLSDYSREHTDWLVSQYHRPDLGEGMVLAFRRGQSIYRTAELRLHGLDPHKMYEVDLLEGATRATGAELMSGLHLTIASPRESVLIRYRRI
ncbi:MAG: hypothetical protein GF320_05155 [Armatimonadia bacterium]|nr:hypothetical protein [Armatimonadia bacterium]